MINSQLLLYLNLGLGSLLVLYFILGRPKAEAPSKLNLKAKDSVDYTKQQWFEPESKKMTQMSSVRAMQVVGADAAATARVATPEPREARSLSILFMYNGHDWEAHEVLGVPQGASMHQVTAAYQQIIKTADTNSLSFYEHAYAAIAERHRKHRL